MRRLSIGVVLVFCAVSALAARGAEPASSKAVLSGVVVRFQSAGTDEVPDFRRHVLPMMVRMGCNARACHGSFQGQGGFRLSLFGYDFQADHEALTGGEHPRADAAEPAASLVLEHPMSEDHGGGQRFTKGSWTYNVLRRWIEAGAKREESDDKLAHLDVQPREITFAKPGETTSLKITAEWADGTREDVTGICRFRTNDETIAEISDEGVVSARGVGDTHVVVFYDNGVVSVPVLMPVSDRVGPQYPRVPASTPLDRLVIEKLQKLGIVPSEKCDDATFLRRASLDLTGTLPAPDEIRAFLADTAPDKRTRKVDELLATPAYAAWWATQFCDWTGNNPAQIADRVFGREQSRQWFEWIRHRIAANEPYDEIVAGMLLAESRDESDESYREFCAEMTAYYRKDQPADFTARPTMPFYWTRRNMRQPEERALSVAHAFLGVRLECAQCHKHPFDQWTQQDFKQFEAFFANIRYGVEPADARQQREMLAALDVNPRDNRALQEKLRTLVAQGQPIPWQEMYVATVKPPPAGKNSKSAKRAAPAPARRVPPKLLGDAEVDTARYPDPRVPLMDWMRAPDNPYFAAALVNRVWANYFGTGIVNPPDDMNLANPPSNAALLDHLAQGFVESGYDLKWLHRTILASDTYQRSWQPNETNKLDERNYSRMVLRRLPAEAAFDAVTAAAASAARFNALRNDLGGRAIAGGGADYRANYVLKAFGKPERLVNCDCERTSDPTIQQTLLLQNDTGLLRQIESGGWFKELASAYKPTKVKRPASAKQRAASAPSVNQHDLERLVDEAFLRTVSRPPSATERTDALAAIAAAESPPDGIRDLVWTLLNTKEFIVNH